MQAWPLGQDHLARITQDTQAQDHPWVTLAVTQDSPSSGSSQEGALLVERGACEAVTCGGGRAGTWGRSQGANQAGPGSRNTVFSRQLKTLSKGKSLFLCFKKQIIPLIEAL